MPKRSNEFQKLVLYISKQLASDTAIITESKMLQDRISGQNREVDIYVEDKSGPYPVTIGIECTATKRKVDTTKLEQLYQKHLNLGIGQTVVVSRSGFNAPAARFAEHKGMVLLTFDNALKKSWPDWLAGLKEIALAHRKIEIKDLQVQVDNISNRTFHFSYAATIRLPQSTGKLTFDDFLRQNLMERANCIAEDLDVEKHEVWGFNPPSELIDEKGTAVLCSRIEVTYQLQQEKVPMEMGFDLFNDSPVAYGISKEVGSYNSMALTASPVDEKTPDGKPKLNLTVHIETDDAAL